MGGEVAAVQGQERVVAACRHAVLRRVGHRVQVRHVLTHRVRGYKSVAPHLIIPPDGFEELPDRFGPWVGRREALDEIYPASLKLDDYVLADYVGPDSSRSTSMPPTTGRRISPGPCTPPMTASPGAAGRS